MIQIVTGDARPIFKQIVDGLRLKIVLGEIVPGTKLPSVRGLAMQLMINTNTVAKAYTELTNLGLVEARKGLGLFVSKPRQLFNDEERRKRLDEAIVKLINEVIGLAFSRDEILDAVKQQMALLEAKKNPKIG